MTRDSNSSTGWTCQACGEAHEPQFETCWNCGADRPDDLPTSEPPKGVSVDDSSADEETSGEVPNQAALSLRDLGALAAKGLALYLFTQAALGAGALFLFLFALTAGTLFYQPSAASFGIAVLGAVVPGAQFLVGWFLWAKADWLSHRMVGNKGGRIVSTTVASQDVLLLSMTAAGVFVFIGGARSLVYVLAPAAMYEGMVLADLWNFVQWRSDLLAAGLSIGLGIWLVLGSRGIVKLVHWLRNAGTTGKYSSEDETVST